MRGYTQKDLTPFIYGIELNSYILCFNCSVLLHLILMIDTLDLVKRQLSFSNAELSVVCLSVICLSVCPSRLMGGGGGGGVNLNVGKVKF